MRSRTKKQFSSSWNAYRILTTNGWSICEHTSITIPVEYVCVCPYLLEKSALLDDVGDGFHLDAFRLIDVLERIEVLGLLVLDHSDLAG